MRCSDATRVAKKFIAKYYNTYAHWNFDICLEHATRGRRKAWSFGLAPDEEDPDYQYDRRFTGYVHADGTVEGLY